MNTEIMTRDELVALSWSFFSRSADTQLTDEEMQLWRDAMNAIDDIDGNFCEADYESNALAQA